MIKTDQHKSRESAIHLALDITLSGFSSLSDSLIHKPSVSPFPLVLFHLYLWIYLLLQHHSFALLSFNDQFSFLLLRPSPLFSPPPLEYPHPSLHHAIFSSLPPLTHDRLLLIKLAIMSCSLPGVGVIDFIMQM